MSIQNNIQSNSQSRQNYSSMNTSINSTKLPRIYNVIDWEKVKKMNKTPLVFDYGCGRYTAHIRDFLLSQDILYFGYDPYWKPECSMTKDDILRIKPTVILCSNVLNVIKENSVVDSIHKIFIDKFNSDATPYFITIYEGDKTGVGKETKKDCWQRNEPTDSYLISAETVRKKVICQHTYAGLIK